jgi:peptidoglycan hydrolase-like protein with peptidoglycan-binding domain
MKAIYNSSDSETKEIISIMTKYGFEAGANWSKNADSPHYQIDGNLSIKGFSRTHTTKFVARAIQKALNKAVNANLTVDGAWGKGVDTAVTKFRKKMGYKLTSPILGKVAIAELFKYL